MKNLYQIDFKILIIILSISFGCQKDKNPVLTTKEITSILATSATSGGIITDEGSGTIIARGVCWSTQITPTISDNKTTDGAGAGGYTSNMTGLKGGTIYYAKAYATNSSGTGYGMAMSFTTLGQAPIAITQDATNILTTSATLNGSVNANYLSTAVFFEYGTTTNYGQTTTATPSPISGNSNTLVSASISSLTTSLTYNFRVKAVNEQGTTYGNNLTFKNNCMSCKNVTYENGAILNSGSSVIYCGADLEVKLSTPPVIIGSLTTKVVCTSI